MRKSIPLFYIMILQSLSFELIFILINFSFFSIDVITYHSIVMSEIEMKPLHESEINKQS
jgi:hypothetical protein